MSKEFIQLTQFTYLIVKPLIDSSNYTSVIQFFSTINLHCLISCIIAKHFPTEIPTSGEMTKYQMPYSCHGRNIVMSLKMEIIQSHQIHRNISRHIGKYKNSKLHNHCRGRSLTSVISSSWCITTNMIPYMSKRSSQM